MLLGSVCMWLEWKLDLVEGKDGNLKFDFTKGFQCLTGRIASCQSSGNIFEEVIQGYSDMSATEVYSDMLRRILDAKSISLIILIVESLSGVLYEKILKEEGRG